MKCTKCGSDTLRTDGDWVTCLACGNIMFNTSIHGEEEKSPTKIVEQIEENMLTLTAEDPVNNIIEPEYPDEQVRREKPKKQKKPKKVKTKSTKKQKSDEEEKQKNPVKDIIDFMLPIVIAVVIAIILKTLVFANVIVPTGSMLNTIQENDRIIASRLSYIFNDPERYDIIIFHYPDDESQYFVKRVIGLPGETVQIVDGIVYVTKTDGNTIQLDDSFVTNCVPTGDYGPYEVPEDSYFVMGDNRNDSLDSRFWDNKYVKKDKIIGKVKFRYYPKISKIE